MSGFLELDEFGRSVTWQLAREVRQFVLRRGRELGAHPAQVGMALHGAAVVLAGPELGREALELLMSSCLSSWLRLREIGVLPQRFQRPLGFGPYPEPEP